MIDTSQDLADVFYSTDDWAHVCTRVRPAAADVPFTGILAVLDDTLFDGDAQAGTHVLQYPTAAVQLQPSDTVRTQRTGPGGSAVGPVQVWRVLRTPDRIVDGAESSVWLWPQG